VCATGLLRPRGDERPMKLLVALEVGADVRIPPHVDPRSGRLREEWLVRQVEPAGARALDLALQVRRAQPDVEVTMVHLGPADNERWLRWGLARGCDQAVRIWDNEAAQAGIAGKAVIVAAAARAIGYDLVLSGSGGLLDSSERLGVLLARCLDVPCVTQVADVDVWTVAAGAPPDRADPDRAGAQRVEFTRALERGFRERVEAFLPLVAAVSAQEPAGEVGSSDGAKHVDNVEGAERGGDGGYVSDGGGVPPSPDVTAAALLAAQERELPVWSLADLGVPLERVRQADQPLRSGRPRPVRPRLRPLKAPDPALPAFDRILELVEGAVERRASRIVRRPAEEMVDEIFRTFKDEGWLDHLRPGNGP
jgi:electron transfer flavoprotein alpha/beta subunit